MKKIFALITALIFIIVTSGVSMAIEVVRQKNAATYLFFPIVDSYGNTVTSATGLDSEYDAWSDGAAPNGFADLTNEATEVSSSGWYYLSMTQSEMNNDYLAVKVTNTTTNGLPQNILIRTTTGDPLLFATTDDGGAINVTSGKIDEVATLTGHTAQTGDNYARLGAPAGASVSADIAAVKSDSGAILTDTGSTGVIVVTNNDKTGYSISGSKTTLDALNDISTSDVDTRLAAIGLDHLLSASVTGTDVTDNSVIAKIVSASATADWDDFVNTTDSMQAIRDRGDAAWDTATGFSTHSAADVWSAGTRTLTALDEDDTTIDLNASAIGSVASAVTVGAFNAAGLSDLFDTDSGTTYASAVAGSVVKEIADNAGGSSLTKEDIAAEVWIHNARTLTSGENIVLAKGTGVTGFNDISAGDVWSNGTRTLTANTNLNDPTAAAIADAVWDESTSGHTTAGTFGEQVKTDIDAILEDTNELQTDDVPGLIAGLNTITAGDVWTHPTRTLTAGTKDTAIDAIKVSTDKLNFNGDGTTLLLVDVRDVNDSAVTGVADFKATGFSTHSAADVWSVATRVLTANTNLNDPTAAAIADAVWDEAQSGHTTPGTFGEYLDEAISGIDDNPWDAVARTITGGVIDTNNDKTGYYINGTITTFDALNNISAADVWAEGTRTLTALDEDSTVIDLDGSTIGTVTTLTGAVTVQGINANAVADLFDTDSGTTYGSAVAGSVVKEIADNAGGSSLTKEEIATEVWVHNARTLTSGENIVLAKGVGVTGFNDLSTAQVNAEVDTALSDINLHKLLSTSATISSDVDLASVIGQLLDDGTSWSYDRTTDSLEQISGLAGGTDWSANEKTEIKTVLGITNTGTPDNTPSAGALYEIQGATFDTSTDSLEAVRNRGDAAWITATGFNTHTVGDIWTYPDRQLTAFDEDVTTIDVDATTIGDVGDKTGYSLSQSFPTNFASLAIDGSGQVTVGANNDKTEYVLSSAGVTNVWTAPTRTLTLGPKDSEIDAIKAKTDSLNFNSDGTPLILADIRDVNDTAVSGVDDFKAVGFNTDTSADIWAYASRELTAGSKDSEIDAIKAKTDQITFTTSNKVDARVDYVGANAVTGPSDFKATGFSTHSETDVWAAGVRTLTAGTKDSEIDAIKAKTDNLPADPADDSDIDAQLAAIQADLDNPTQYQATSVGLTSAAVDAIWDEPQSGHTTAGTFGKYLDSEISGVAGGNSLTSVDIENAVWNATLADHLSSGSTGEQLNNAAAAGNPWSTDVSNAYTGQAGGYLRGIFDATDGDKESGEYTGIENIIRRSR